jgi:hypothetical protein
MVEPNIQMTCAVALIEASVSKSASNTPALLKRSKHFHNAVPMPEALRQSAPAHGLDGEEMQRLGEAAIVLGLPPATRQTNPPVSRVPPCYGAAWAHADRFTVVRCAESYRQVQVIVAMSGASGVTMRGFGMFSEFGGAVHGSTHTPASSMS